MLTIELDRCDGCGVCVEVCPEGAISLVDGVARIDSASCTECEVCVQACPSGARPSALATLAGATLSFIGSQLLPRAADAIVNALDRRLSEKPAAESGEATPTTGKSGGRRHRKRGGQG